MSPSISNMYNLFNFISKRPKRILIAVSLITAVFILLLSGTSIQSDFYSFIAKRFVSPLNYIHEHFEVHPSQSVTIEAINNQSILSLPLLKEQNQLFATIEKRWPVNVESIVGLINMHVQAIQELKRPNEEPRYNLYDIEDQEIIDNLIAGLYFLNPYEFERIARKSLSDEGFIDTMQELNVLSSIIGGFGANLQFQLPKIRAARAAITLDENLPRTESQRIFSEIRSFTDDFSPNLKIRHYSTELFDIDIDNRLMTNSPLVIGAMVILLIIVLFYTFRSWFFTLLPIGILALTILWAFGILSLTGVKELSTVHIVAIPLLLGQCIDNLIHFNERFLQEYARISKKEALKIVFNTAGKAAGLTTLINMTAFAVDYIYLDLIPMKHYALLIILGIGLALLLTYFICGASLLLTKIPPTESSLTKEKISIHAKRLFDFIHKHYLIVLFITFSLLALMMSNALKVDRSFRPTSYMSKNSPVYDAYEFERKNFNLYMPHYVLLKGNVATEQTLEAVKAIENTLDTFEDIEHIHNKVNTESLTYLLSKFDPRSFPDSIEELYDKLAESDVMINLLLGRTASDAFSDIVEEKNGQYIATLIKLWPEERDSKSITNISKEVEDTASAYANTNPYAWVEESDEPDGELYVQTTGEFLALSLTQNEAFNEFFFPAFITLLIIILYLWKVFKRVLSIFITIIPVFCGVIFTYGSLYLVNSELNSLNGSIGVLAVGLGIDYSIQIMMRYHEELKRYKNPTQAMRKVFGYMVIPLGQCALLTSAGLIVLTGLLPVAAKFGIVSTIAILTGYLGAVFILPIFAVKFAKNRNSAYLRT